MIPALTGGFPSLWHRICKNWRDFHSQFLLDRTPEIGVDCHFGKHKCRTQVLLLFYLKIIYNITILPPIIISVVVSKFFTESIRFEIFELISVLVFVEGDVTVFVVVFIVVVKGSSLPGNAM